MEHCVALHPDVMGKVTYVAPTGQYSLKDTMLELEFQGIEKKFTMLQRVPVCTPRPVASKLAADTPLLTGQRVLDALSPQYLVGLVPYPELLVVEKQSLVKLFLSIQILKLLFTLVVENMEMKWQKSDVLMINTPMQKVWEISESF